MSKYKCLRTCYASERLYRKDEVYDLRDSMKKTLKNFQPLEGQGAAEGVEVAPLYVSDKDQPKEEEATATSSPEEGPPLAGEAVIVTPLHLSDKPKRKRTVREKTDA